MIVGLSAFKSSDLSQLQGGFLETFNSVNVLRATLLITGKNLL